jgi:hypothetical protein
LFGCQSRAAFSRGKVAHNFSLRYFVSAQLYYIDIGKFDRVSFDMLYRCDPKFQDMPPSMFPVRARSCYQ